MERSARDKQEIPHTTPVNRGEHNSADSRRNIPQVRGGGEGGEVQHLTASGKKARITAPKGLRKRLTGHAGRP